MNAHTVALQQPLPDYKHQPGANPRPAEDFLAAALFDFPTPVTDDNWQLNSAWCFGVRLINESFFWEAHEAMEPVWMKTRPNAREHHLVQGVIQLANGALKAGMGKSTAASKLGVLAEECISRAYTGMNNDQLMGLEKDALMLAIATIPQNVALPQLILAPAAASSALLYTDQHPDPQK